MPSQVFYKSSAGKTTLKGLLQALMEAGAQYYENTGSI